MHAAGSSRPGRWRAADLGRLLGAWATSTVTLMIAAALLPGLRADHWWLWGVAAAVTGVVGVLLRPLLVVVAAGIGWLGLLALALVGQAVVVQVALSLVPGIHSTSFLSAVGAAWATAAVGTVISWLSTAGTPESLVLALTRDARGRRRPPAPDDPDLTGVLFVQLDGVPAPMLRWALQAGLMPTVRRWVVDGSHDVHEWTVQMPCTTPASQLGILHGTVAAVPAFRWFDRELGRVLVANRPADARIIEDRASDGRGLLADGGMSVSNLFSGDAARCSMVMSRTEVTRGSRETRRVFAWFVARPDGLARSISRAIAELARERFQARRQHRRDVQPRVHRPWPFTALRATTNGLLRDVNLAVVSNELLAGTRSVYVDFLDYDEVAHHAGPATIEAMQVLTELDQVVAVLEQVAAIAPRHYEIVLLSDHGQASGLPFDQRFGEDLAAVCQRLMHAEVAWEGEPVEAWGPVRSLAGDIGSEETVGGRVANNVARRIDRHTASDVEPGILLNEPVVLGSGNLGLLYVGERGRLALEDLEERWPALVPGLAGHPGIGFVAGLDRSGHAIAIGVAGRRDLVTGGVEGRDPLAGFPEHSAEVLAVATSMTRAPDLYLNSILDVGTGEVAAFESLVGSHGGLGGWQDRGMLVLPRGVVPQEPLVGADAVHRCLVGMLTDLGHRSGLAEAEPRVAATAAPQKEIP